jgi:hypothetical protein
MLSRLLVSSNTKDEKVHIEENQTPKPQFEFSLNTPVSYTFILIEFQSYNKMNYEFYLYNIVLDLYRPKSTALMALSFVSVYSDLYINKFFLSVLECQHHGSFYKVKYSQPFLDREKETKHI